MRRKKNDLGEVFRIANGQKGNININLKKDIPITCHLFIIKLMNFFHIIETHFAIRILNYLLHFHIITLNHTD